VAEEDATPCSRSTEDLPSVPVMVSACAPMRCTVPGRLGKHKLERRSETNGRTLERQRRSANEVTTLAPSPGADGSRLRA